MDELPGALGTSASLALRLGQFIFSIASLIFMCLDVHFYAYTAFWYLATNCFYQKQLNSKSSTSIYGPCASFSVTIMSLMIPWSLTLAVVDVYFVLCKRPSRQPGIKSVIVIGDWVLSFLSLAAACSTASVTDVLITSRTLCMAKLCNRYQLSAAMTFLSWFLSLASSLFNLWLLPSP
ncbi:CASP-like protein 5C3 isoform X1 [Diospyros lotus]|uniref:CASP-like protein 5C3 isoform X1 n=1 Tax=Diospyros lotus TaxID=55363 RepID=UPI00225767CA|nr:CASP-like protein 5C3 isoform X1 [Diospyros lotus]